MFYSCHIENKIMILYQIIFDYNIYPTTIVLLFAMIMNMFSKLYIMNKELKRKTKVICSFHSIFEKLICLRFAQYLYFSMHKIIVIYDFHRFLLIIV